MAGTAFVGRRGELDRLGRVLRGDPGAAAAAVVTGDAGIGKTRLLAEAVGAAPGVLVLSGGCLPLSESLPYGAVSDALTGLTRPGGRPTLDRALARCAAYVQAQVGALVPALTPEAGVAPDTAVERTRLFAAVRELLGALGAERRTALVVEDLHWADPGTLDLLTTLVSAMPPGSALVTTSRRDELPAEDRARDWLAGTLRLPTVETLSLAPLPNDDVEAMVASLVGDEPGEAFVADVLRRGEGSPFFTEQLVAAARDVAPPLTLPAGVPAGVAQMLLSRVRSVGPAATEVAAALAVAARPITEGELGVCVGTGVDVAPALRELLDAHLVAPAADDRYRLRHALLEDTVSATLLASQRAGLHAGIAAVLAARAGESPAEVATHWARAGNRVEEARWSVEAARHAEGVYAWPEASGAWRRVWDLWSSLPPGEGPPVELGEVVVRCVVDARRIDDDSLFQSLARHALADERVTADDHATGRLLRVYGHRLLVTDLPAGLAALEQAVARFEQTGLPSAEQARAIQCFAAAKMSFGALSGTEEAELARAAAIAEEVGALDVMLEVATDRSLARLAAGQVEEGLADLTTVLRQATEGGAHTGAVWALVMLSDAYLSLLRLDDGIDVGRRGIPQVLAHGYRDSFDFSVLVSNTADCLVLRGDIPAAEELVTAYLPPQVTAVGSPIHQARAELDMLGGDPAAALSRLEAVERLGYRYPEQDMWRAELTAGALLWHGRPREAAQCAERGRMRVEGTRFATHAGRTLALAARAAADTADLDPGAARDRLVHQLRAHAAEVDCFGLHPEVLLSAAHQTTFDGELARLERVGEERAWRVAKDNWASYSVPHHAAYAGWRLAEALLADGRRVDAEAELASAYLAAETHVPLRREIEGLARRARLALPDTDPATPAEEAEPTRDATRGLTPREIDVLRLLGSGATNAEIGRRLYISPKTASVHVTAILRKLGVNGRVQAATVADRMGLLGSDADGSHAP